MEAGYNGHKTAFYALVAGARPPRATPVVRFEGLPGELSQHDFGQVDVRFIDGRVKRVHSRVASEVLALRRGDDRRQRAHRDDRPVLARDFVAFGGLPLLAVFDRPKTIVKKGGTGRDVEASNATFAQAIVDLGVGVEMCAPRSGNQKGAVERLVGWVKGAFFKHRRFQDESDLRDQLTAWLVDVNTKTPSRATGAIPETKRQEELVRLRPIKVFPEKLALRIPILVGPTAEVMFEAVPYSMPPEATHVAGALILYEDRLRIVACRIVACRFEAIHRRRTKGDPFASLPSCARRRSPPFTTNEQSSTRSDSRYSTWRRCARVADRDHAPRAEARGSSRRGPLHLARAPWRRRDARRNRSRRPLREADSRICRTSALHPERPEGATARS